MSYSLITVVSITAALAAVLAVPTPPSLAEDIISHLSVGHDRFTLATPDPKVAAPAVLGAKYGFSAAKGFKPYLGTGIAYSLMPEVKPSDVMKLKTGVAAQAGASYQLGGNFSLSLDYKYMYLAPDVHQNDSTPQSIGVGVNIKF
jgi:outer membrane protein W